MEIVPLLSTGPFRNCVGDACVFLGTGGEDFEEVLGENDQADVDSLNAGTFDDRLLTTIDCTPNFMVILSEGSLDRCADEDDWLRREITHAIQTERNIVPVMMPRFQWPKEGALPEVLETLPRYNSLPYQHDCSTNSSTAW